MKSEHAAPGAPQQEASGDDHPTGAIVNGRVCIERLEYTYNFECEAGPLAMCDDWQRLRQCFEHLVEHASRAAATAPAGGVADQQIKDLSEKDEFWRLLPGYEPERRYELDAVAFGRAVLALTTAARAAEPAIHLGAEGQKVFAETLLNPPPPTAAFLKAEESYSNLVRPEATAPAGGVTDEREAMTAAYMAFCKDKAPDRNEVGFAYFKAAWQARAALTTSARAAEPTDAELEVGRKAIEDALIEYRDSRISEPFRGNGLVIREKDGTESSVIRFGPETALRIGIRAMLAASTTPPTGTSNFIPCRCFDDTSRRLCMNKGKCSRIEAATGTSKEGGEHGA